MSKEDNVYRIDFDKAKLASVETRRSKKKCGHNRVMIDEDAHVVFCESCGSRLDPLVILLRYVHDGYMLEGMRRERKRLLAEIKRLKEEEKDQRKKVFGPLLRKGKGDHGKTRASKEALKKKSV